MAQEKEIKIKLVTLSLPEFVERIRHKGYALDSIIQQEDIYFDREDWYLYEHIAALRLRKVNGKDESFSFKKVFHTPDKSNRFYVEEIETKAPFTEQEVLSEIFAKVQLPVPPISATTGEELIRFLRQQGYYDEQHMPKTRSIYHKRNSEIVIDEVDKVGIIIELECISAEPLEVIQEILNPQEWTRSNEGTSYVWLEKVKNLSSHHSNFARFSEEPNWNVWDHEKVWYQSIL